MAKHKLTCAHCGKEFENYFSNAKFCCRECYLTHRKLNSKCKTVTCPICGKQFLQTRPEMIFCSVECRTKSTQVRLACICDNCGKKFLRKKSEVDKCDKHYCSTKCRRDDREWSEGDTEIIRQYYRKIPTKEISKLLSRPRDQYAIRRRAQYIGLGKSREWSDDEIKALVENYSKVTMREVEDLIPGRTRASILGQARQQGLLSNHYISKIYSDDEISFIKANYLTMSNEEMGQILGRTELAISERLILLDLHRPAKIDSYKKLQRYIRCKITPWRDKYMADHNYTCELTGKYRDVVVHHIRGFNLLFQEAMDNVNIPFYNDISDYTQEELDIILEEFLSVQSKYDEVICLSEHVHKEFHGKYGYGGNTREQWDEFVTNYYTS